MPTYHEVMTTELSKLTTAADKWDDMAGEFKKLEEQYKRDVHGISTGQTWLGVSSNAANGRFTVTLNEYKAAQKEAKAIAALLRDAHTQFVDLRGRLKSVRDDAVKDGMKVSEQGHVSFDTARLSDSERTAYVHDVSYQESARTAAGEWNQAITAAVKAVSDADDGVRIALEAVVIDSNLQDGTYNGFNAGAKDDVEEYEAEHAKDIATRINSGEKVSAADMAELQRSFRDNSDNKAFSQTFLNGLGPAGTIQLGNRLNDLAYGDDKDRKKDYLSLQKGLATTLVTATKDPTSEFYKKFRDDLQKAGVQKYDLGVAAEKIAIGKGHGQEVRGYQSLVSLMQQGEGYSGQFLKDLANDIRAAEDKKQGGDPDIWDLRGDFNSKNEGWFANDPLDGVLGIMSEDPATATNYLDPGPDGKNDNLQYLLTERDWNLVDTSDWSGNVERTGKDTFDEDVKSGLGLALEAGTTGREPASPGSELGRHSEEQARIMHDTINLLDYGNPSGKEGDEDRVGNADTVLKADDNANIRGPLTRAMASYSPDMVDILSGDGPGGRVGEADSLADGSNSEIQNSRSSLLRMMRGASEDSENYFLLRRSEQAYMNELLATEDFSDMEGVKNRAAKIGEVFGAMNAVGGDLDLSERDVKLAEAGDQRVYGYHVVGGLVTGVPIIGDIAQRSVDAYWNEWLKGVSGEEGLLAREKLSAGNDAAGDSLDSYFKNWGDADQRSGGEVSAAQREARQSYMGGRELAFDALRERK